MCHERKRRPQPAPRLPCRGSWWSKARSRRRTWKKTLERLQAYRESDPDVKAAYAGFVEAEMTYDDPLEGEPYEIENPARSKVQSLLTDA